MSEPETGRNSRAVWLGAGVALVIVLLLAVVSAVSDGSDGAKSPGAAAADAKTKARAAAARRIPGDPLALGDPAAPVTIVEWADFQCPFCAVFTRDTAGALIAQYVNTGKARLEWRDFAFLGPESTASAVAARAAGRQGKFWAYHDALFARQPPENSGGLSTAFLVGLARELGLDVARFQADTADPALAEQVAADQAQATPLGITGTPTVLVNGKLLSGALPLADYQAAIDAALAGTPPAK